MLKITDYSLEYLEGLVIRLIELPELLGSDRKKVRKRTWKIVDDIVMPKVWDFVNYDDYHGFSLEET